MRIDILEKTFFIDQEENKFRITEKTSGDSFESDVAEEIDIWSFEKSGLTREDLHKVMKDESNLKFFGNRDDDGSTYISIKYVR